MLVVPMAQVRYCPALLCEDLASRFVRIKDSIMNCNISFFGLGWFWIVIYLSKNKTKPKPKKKKKNTFT